VTYTNGVATGQGYHVGGIQALGGERWENCVGVSKGWREVV
jgi:hypothetical protein